MKMNIVQQENPVLRATAQEVASSEFGTPALKKLVEKMSAALTVEEDGVALAAPQIGISKRLFVVSQKVFGEKPTEKDLVFINPKITTSSKTKVAMEEGCLSVRWIYGQTRRAEKVTLQAFDLTGKKITRHASGLLAQIFQHEIDHLNGILFTDTAKNLQEIKPEDLPLHD